MELAVNGITFLQPMAASTDAIPEKGHPMNRCAAKRPHSACPPGPVMHATSEVALADENEASSIRYTGQALATTAKAFTLPTILAPLLLPASLYCLRFLATGVILADQLVKGRAVDFTPPADPRQSLVATSFGLFPFIPGFALHARLSETYFSDPQTRGSKLMAEFGKAWSGFCSRLPKSIANVMRSYPLNFAFGFGVTQLTASAAGSGLSASYHRARGAKLVHVKRTGSPKKLVERVKTNPDAYIAGASLFTIPTFLSSPPVQTAIKGAGLSGPAASAIIATGVVVAAGALSLKVTASAQSL
jgi:hypothetical protein